MNSWKHALPLAIVLFFALLLAACASQAVPPPTGGNIPPATPSAQAPAASVHTARIDVKGTQKTVLVDRQGRTLYYFTPDTRTVSKCTLDCAGTWPAYLFSGAGSPIGSSDITGKLTVQATANGQQVEYSGHLLYTFSGDAGPGQANGEGIGGKWFVATPDLASLA